MINYLVRFNFKNVIVGFTITPSIYTMDLSAFGLWFSEINKLTS